MGTSDNTTEIIILYISRTIAESASCNVPGDPMTYYIILIMGFSFGIIYVFVALYSKKYPMKYLIGKKVLFFFVLNWNKYANKLCALSRHMVADLRCGNNCNILDQQFLS